jgi:IS1 family transposase
VTTDAISAWVLKAADHVNELTVYLEREMHLTQCQIDEFWSYIFKKKRLSEDEMDREDVGDRWTFVNVLPRSGLIQTVHHGKRTKEEGEEFIKTIKQNSDGEAPLFLSDGWPSYPEILASAYSHEEAVPYSGRGRPRKPIRIRDENLKYAQVIKHEEGGRLIEIEKRVV